MDETRQRDDRAANAGGGPISKDRLLSTLMDNASDHIYFKDAQSRFIMISHSMTRIFGLQSADEAIGKTDFDFFTEEHARKAYEDEQTVMRTGTPLINREEKETWPDGRTTWVTSTKMPLLGAAGEMLGTYGISRDVTDKKLAEEELRRHREELEELIEERTVELRTANVNLQHEIEERKRAEKAVLEGVRVATMRSMAGGVAVAFNQITGLINAYATSIAANFIPSTHVHDEATRIIEATRRAAKLTRQLSLMAHAGGETPGVEPMPVALRDVVADAVGLVGELLRDRNVALEVANPEAMPFVSGDRARLVDTVLAFLINAAEAMPGGGAVRLDASTQHVRRPPARYTKAVAGDYAVLRIRDSGMGMDVHVRKQIFEPFFTTKDPKQSFGLGLSFAQTTIIDMGGWIAVSSRQGRGASFRIFLPCVAGGTTLDMVTSEPNGAEVSTVLVVDDELDQLQMMKEALEQAGFNVLTADGAHAGVTVFGRHSGQIHLFVIDAVMASGGAERVVKRIRRADPQACVLITSGFSRDYVRGVLPLGPWGFLQKPFDSGQLIKAVRDTMRQNAPG